MVGDKWSMKGAILFGVLLGPPLRVVYDAIGNIDFPDTGRGFLIYLGINMIIGGVAVALLVLLRNRLLAEEAKR